MTLLDRVRGVSFQARKLEDLAVWPAYGPWGMYIRSIRLRCLPSMKHRYFRNCQDCSSFFYHYSRVIGTLSEGPNEYKNGFGEIGDATEIGRYSPQILTDARERIIK